MNTLTFDQDGRICCPHCGGAATHLSEPAIVSNPEDKYLIVNIEVECESCHIGTPHLPPFVLEIRSGKGQSFVSWKDFR